MQMIYLQRVIISFFILVALSALSTQGNVFLNGVGYTPYPSFGYCPGAVSTIEQELSVILRHSFRLRVYSTECPMVMRTVLRYASEGQLELLLGVWIDNRPNDQKEIDDLIVYLAEYPHARISGIVVGNEPLLRGTMTPSQVAARVLEVKQKVRELADSIGSGSLEVVPIFSVEAFPNAEVVAVSDAVGANIHPFYCPDLSKEGDAEFIAYQALEKAKQFIQDFYTTFPGKPLYITEIGWPSSSSQNEPNKGDVKVTQEFMKKWTAYANSMNLNYFWFEIFDSNWKKPMFPNEGSTYSEFNWGLFHIDRKTSKVDF